MSSAHLVSRRLSLVPLTCAQIEPVHALWTEPEVRQYLWDDEVISLDIARDHLRGSERDFRERGFGLWGLHTGSAGPLAGFCGLREADLMPDPELLFGLRRAFWGRGLAREAAETVLRFGFSSLALPAIGAATDVPNVRSIRLLERLGMGLVPPAAIQPRPTVFYRLTTADWTMRVETFRHTGAGSDHE